MAEAVQSGEASEFRLATEQYRLLLRLPPRAPAQMSGWEWARRVDAARLTAVGGDLDR
jgi:hypothetical protein